MTHYTESAYDELAGVLKAEELDFVQLNYSIAERAAERRLLPLAAERRMAVLVNRPFAVASRSPVGPRRSVALAGRNSFSSLSSRIQQSPVRFRERVSSSI